MYVKGHFYYMIDMLRELDNYMSQTASQIGEIKEALIRLKSHNESKLKWDIPKTSRR
jgi:hypothetical protein